MEETRTGTLTCDQLFHKNLCREFQPLAPKWDRGQGNSGSQNKHIWVIGHKEQTCSFQDRYVSERVVEFEVKQS